MVPIIIGGIAALLAYAAGDSVGVSNAKSAAAERERAEREQREREARIRRIWSLLKTPILTLLLIFLYSLSNLSGFGFLPVMVEKYYKISKDWTLSLGVDLWRTFTELPWYYEVVVVIFSVSGVFFLFKSIKDYIEHDYKCKDFKIALLLSLLCFGMAVFSDLGLKSLA